MRHIVQGALAVAVLLCAPLTSAPADDFPGKPITVMVGLAPGGITDVTARLYAEVVARNTGQRITIETALRPPGHSPQRRSRTQPPTAPCCRCSQARSTPPWRPWVARRSSR